MIPSKDTIYIDIDDEITGIINKMQSSHGKIVALVLPKRASVLQSIVNMRLLKRAADEAKKNVVLITSEAGLLPLAGVAGMHVAKTLDSKPSIPMAPASDDIEETIDEDANVEQSDKPATDRDTEITVANAGAIAVGALAGLPPKDDVETLELEDDEDVALPLVAGSEVKTVESAKIKKDTKLKVPNFNRFRLLLVGGVLLLVLLIAGFVVANKVLPKAVITIGTDASNVNASVTLTLSSTATALDATTNTVPAKLVSEPKTYTQTAPTTGQKNIGDKATGTVTMTAKVCTPANLGTPPDSVPKGTGVSTAGMTYITQVATTFSSILSASSNCVTYSATASTAITSQSGGISYNKSGTFSVAGRPDVTATGSASGGTDNLLQVLSQADIDGAKAKIVTDDATIKQDLSSQLTKAGFYPITVTFSTGTPTVTTSANVGDATATVTVTEVVTYTMYGAHLVDLNTLVDNNVKTQIDTTKQSVTNEGVGTGSFTVQSSTATTAQLTMQTTATVGPQLNVATIKKQVAGKKTGDVKSLLQGNPDVTSVNVKLGPFWVTSVPKDVSKITVNITVPTKVNTPNVGTP